MGVETQARLLESHVKQWQISHGFAWSADRIEAIARGRCSS
jgi:hypothetical protein